MGLVNLERTGDMKAFKGTTLGMILKILSVIMVLIGTWNFAEMINPASGTGDTLTDTGKSDAMRDKDIAELQAEFQATARKANAVSEHHAATWLSLGAAVMLWWLAAIADYMAEILEALRCGRSQGEIPNPARKTAVPGGSSGKALLRKAEDSTEYKL